VGYRLLHFSGTPGLLVSFFPHQILLLFAFFVFRGDTRGFLSVTFFFLIGIYPSQRGGVSFETQKQRNVCCFSGLLWGGTNLWFRPFWSFFVLFGLGNFPLFPSGLETPKPGFGFRSPLGFFLFPIAVFLWSLPGDFCVYFNG